MGKAYLLTGDPGIGKTTTLKKIIDVIGRERCGGFYTEEVRALDKRRGFRMVDLHGPVRTIADIAFESKLRVGKYGVDQIAIEDVGSTALSHARQYDEIIVIDEMGPMQLLSEKIKQWTLAVLESPKPVIGTMAAKSDDPFLHALRQRDGVRLFSMTSDNRDTIHQIFLDAITDGCLL